MGYVIVYLSSFTIKSRKCNSRLSHVGPKNCFNICIRQQLSGLNLELIQSFLERSNLKHNLRSSMPHALVCDVSTTANDFDRQQNAGFAPKKMRDGLFAKLS